MKTIMEVLEPLDGAARESVLTWVSGQLGIKHSNVGSHGDGQRSAATTNANNGHRPGTINVVAPKLGAQSARELLLAAAAHLTAYQGKDSFTRDELVERAKEARNWKSNHANQIAINIKRMLDAGELFEKARDVFSLSEEALNDIEGRLAA
jgi:hypothetical protein